MMLTAPPATPAIPDVRPFWTHEQAVELCKKIEMVCPAYGCHVALTGGSLYKEGPRKDCDLIFYRIRQVEKIDDEGLWYALEQLLNFKKVSGFGWCHKATYEGRSVDCLFPEEIEGEYGA